MDQLIEPLLGLPPDEAAFLRAMRDLLAQFPDRTRLLLVVLAVRPSLQHWRDLVESPAAATLSRRAYWGELLDDIPIKAMVELDRFLAGDDDEGRRTEIAGQLVWVADTATYPHEHRQAAFAAQAVEYALGCTTKDRWTVESEQLASWAIRGALRPTAGDAFDDQAADARDTAVRQWWAEVVHRLSFRTVFTDDIEATTAGRTEA